MIQVFTAWTSSFREKKTDDSRQQLQTWYLYAWDQFAQLHLSTSRLHGAGVEKKTQTTETTAVPPCCPCVQRDRPSVVGRQGNSGAGAAAGITRQTGFETTPHCRCGAARRKQDQSMIDDSELGIACGLWVCWTSASPRLDGWSLESSGDMHVRLRRFSKSRPIIERPSARSHSRSERADRGVYPIYCDGHLGPGYAGDHPV
jgi:hypothetical protein